MYVILGAQPERNTLHSELRKSKDESLRDDVSSATTEADAQISARCTVSKKRTGAGGAECSFTCHSVLVLSLALVYCTTMYDNRVG